MKCFLNDKESSIKPWKKVVLMLILILVVGYIVFMGAYFATSEPSFCTSCHQIKPYVTSWRQSPHKDVKCHYCHDNRGFVGKINAKLTRGLNNAYLHVTGQYTIITKGKVSEQNCIACHLGDYRNYSETKRLDMMHYEFMKIDKLCLQCHRDIGHEVNLFSQEKFRK